MTLYVTVFGFGSHFDKIDSAEDIDLLVVHDNVSTESCALAIHCKRCLIGRISKAHVTMLSATEEEHFGFIVEAKAVRLGTVRASHLNEDTAVLCSQHL